MKKLFLLALASILFNSLSAVEDQPTTVPISPMHDVLKNHDISTPPTSEEVPHDFYDDFTHMLYVLGIMVAVLLLATWALKKLQATRLQGSNKESMIKVLETRNLSARSSIHFIEILNKGIIIGESHAGLVRLAEIPLDDYDDSVNDETTPS